MHIFDFFDDVVYIPTMQATPAPAPVLLPSRLGLDRLPRLRQVAAIKTPADARIGMALTHRRVAQEAFDASRRTVLVVAGNTLLLDDALHTLGAALAELARQHWGVCHLGHWSGSDKLVPVAGCQWLARSAGYAQAGAYALHARALPALLADMPADFATMQAWVAKHGTFDDALRRLPHSYTLTPGIACQPAFLPYQPLALQDRFAA